VIDEPMPHSLVPPKYCQPAHDLAVGGFEHPDIVQPYYPAGMGHVLSGGGQPNSFSSQKMDSQSPAVKGLMVVPVGLLINTISFKVTLQYPRASAEDYLSLIIVGGKARL
jgi:hypothetical protein